MNVTDTGNTSYLNWTLNATTENHQEVVYHISIVSQVVNVAITALTVILNCAMIKCLQTQRSKIPEMIYLQLMSLSISDVIAGIAPATTCFTLMESVNRNTKACTALLVTFSIAQYAVLLNLCTWSIKRFIVLRKAGQPKISAKPSLLWTVFCSLCPWLVSCLFNLSIISVAIARKSSINGCLSPNLFENRKALTAGGVIYFGTLFLLNAFNILSAFQLKRLKGHNTSDFNSNREGLLRRAFRNLLAVLMVVNITSVPKIAVAVTQEFQMNINPATVYIVNHFQALNSLINPILHSIQINEIRAVIKARVLSCLGRKRNVATRNDINDIPGTDRHVYVTPT